MRTCCSCWKRRNKDELIRFVWDGNKIVEDRTRSRQGRGAYCCDNEKCYTLFFKNKKNWQRAFRL
ncbi:MAG: hypothetical protein CR992_00540 [Desulfobacterales bacterium]|nr:MAG: hypothetical protein CR992_00540 [Desulfobacterales bacterium]